MVAPIPTFESSRQTQAGNTGIVSFDGGRQMASAFQSVGQVFDRIGEFQERKANEAAAREAQKQGQEIALSKGFDPSKMKEPLTAVDQIYRQSALQTYAISLESDVNNKVNDAFIRNVQNPEGFKREAQAYVDRTVQSVPFELRNGVARMATTNIDQRYVRMRFDNQRRVMAEMEKAEQIYLSGLTEQFAIAKSPEERQIIDEKIKTTIANSASYATDAGKAAVYDGVRRKMAYGAVFNKVVNSEVTPIEAIDSLEAAGIAPSNEMVSQIYSAAGREFKYKEAEFKANEATRIQAINDVTNTMLLEINKYRGGPGFEDIYGMIQTKADAIILSAGGSADDIMNFQKAAQKMAFGSQEDNLQVTTMLDGMIFNLDPNARPKIDQAFQSGQITQSTYQSYVEKETKARAGIASNPTLKKYIENEFVPQYAPMAKKAVPGWENIYSQSEAKDSILQDKEKVDALVAKAITMSQTTPMDEVVRQLSSDIRANQTQTPAVERAKVLANSPNRKTIENMYAKENFDLTYIDLKTRKRGLYSEKNAPDSYREILKGPWNQSNYMARLKLMQKQNSIAIAAGLEPPYAQDLMEEMLQTWN
jgi:hypothetical protein